MTRQRDWGDWKNIVGRQYTKGPGERRPRLPYFDRASS